ncbi:hypothetical protein B7463_g8309, partial [Scytalidium lignicola]
MGSLGSAIDSIWQRYMATGMENWRWIMRWGAIFCGLILIVFFFFLEESLFYRSVGEREVDITSKAPQEESSTNHNFTSSTKSEMVKTDVIAATQSPPVFTQYRQHQLLISYASKLMPWHNFPVSWNAVGHKIKANITIISYPAVIS